MVEAGARVVSLSFGRWDSHGANFDLVRDHGGKLDQCLSALVEDLDQRGMLQDVTIAVWGEFGRTPKINQNAGRDHFARAWSCVVGGGDITGGVAVGETSSDGMAVETQPFSSEDLMTTVCKGLGISTEKTFTSKNGRPMKIAGGGKIISELVA